MMGVKSRGVEIERTTKTGEEEKGCQKSRRTLDRGHTQDSGKKEAKHED